LGFVNVSVQSPRMGSGGIVVIDLVKCKEKRELGIDID
jgi:hypothetical protein